jgi:L-iditol 2-dehydrogenase
MNHDGAYAEHVLLPSDHVHRLDNGADLRRHALVEPLAVVHKALGRLRLDDGDGDGDGRCAVIGAGTIGNLAGQVLAARGHEVAVFEADPSRLASLPATLADRRERVEGLEAFDVIVEATGSRRALEAVLGQAAASARLLLLGFPYGEMPFNFERIVAGDRVIVGSVGSGPEDFRAAIELIGRLELDRFLEASFPLERFADAWAAQRRHDHLKVMLEVRP